MSKELEALERTSSEFIDGYPTGNVNVGMTWEEHSAINQALQRLESIDNANPSEALEKFNIIKFNPDDVGGLQYLEAFKVVELALIKSQEQEKTLNIILEKNVDIIMIRMSETLDKYNQMIYKDSFNRKELTKEEFNSVKSYCKQN